MSEDYGANDDGGFHVVHMVRAQRGFSDREFEIFLATGQKPDLSQPPPEELEAIDGDTQVMPLEDAAAWLSGGALTASSFFDFDPSHSVSPLYEVVRPKVEAFRFNKNQPRDEDGKWTDGPLGGVGTLIKKTAASTKQATPAVIYKKHDDGAVIGHSVGGQRMRWDAGSKKYVVEKRQNGKWVAQSSLAKGAAYTELKKPDTWFEPGGDDDNDQANAPALTTPDTTPGASDTPKLSGAYQDEKTGLRAEVDNVETTDSGFTSKGTIRDTDGADAGRFEVTVGADDEGRKFARIDDIRVQNDAAAGKKHKGQGFGSRWYQQFEDKAREEGVDYIELTDFTDGYWDRFGFEEHWNPGPLGIGKVKRLTPNAQSSNKNTSLSSSSTKIKPSAIYAKHGDGDTVAQSADGATRMRWDAGRKKFIVEKQKGDGWAEESALNKTSAYNEMKNPDKWFEPAETSTENEPSSPSLTPEPAPVDTDTTAETVDESPKVPQRLMFAADINPDEQLPSYEVSNAYDYETIAPSAAAAWYEKAKAAYGGEWTDVEKKSLRAYTNDSYVNSYLRGDKTSIADKHIRTAKQVQQAMRPSLEPVLLHRGTDFNGVGGAKNYDDLKNMLGQTSRDDGFFSTSVGGDDAFHSHQVIIEVEAPPGTPMAWVGDGSDSDGNAVSTRPYENEMILAAGLHYQTISVSKKADGKPVVRVRVVPDPEVTTAETTLPPQADIEMPDAAPPAEVAKPTKMGMSADDAQKFISDWGANVDLSDDDRQAINDWAAPDMSAMRGMQTHLQSDAELTPDETALRDKLDTIAERGKLPEAVKVYRVVKPWDAIKGDVTGKTVTEHGYQATSLAPDDVIGMWGAAYAAAGQDPVIFEMNVPEGMPAFTPEWNKSTFAHELTLGRDVDMKITGTREETMFVAGLGKEHTFTVLTMDVTPRTKTPSAPDEVKKPALGEWDKSKSPAWNLVMQKVDKSFPPEARQKIANLLTNQEEFVGDRLARVQEIKNGVTHPLPSNDPKIKDKITALTVGGKIHVSPKLWVEDAERTDKRKGDNFKVDGGDSSFETTLAHEIGHALMQQHLSKKDWSDLADLTAKTFGLDTSSLPAKNDRNAWSLKQWFTKPENKKIIEADVSRYGASSMDEFTGEVWAEFTTNPNPSDKITAIGDFLQHRINPDAKKSDVPKIDTPVVNTPQVDELKTSKVPDVPNEPVTPDIPKQVDAPEIESAPTTPYVGPTATGYEGTPKVTADALRDAYIAEIRHERRVKARGEELRKADPEKYKGWDAFEQSENDARAELASDAPPEHVLGDALKMLDDAQSEYGTYDKVRRRLNYEASLEVSFEQFSEKHGLGKLTPAVKADLAKQTKDAFAGKKVAVRVSAKTVEHILNDGRFKSQFESGKSKGKKDTDMRASVEKTLFGIDDKPWQNAEKRPIYGYVAVDGIRPAGIGSGSLGDPSTDQLTQYGNVQVVLKDSVRSRTTAMFGDSLNEMTQGTPSPIDDPDWKSYTAGLGILSSQSLDGLDRSGESARFRSNSYAEAQIHDGVSVDDIEEVVFASNPTATVKKQLEDAGIPYRVLTFKTAADGSDEERANALRIAKQDKPLIEGEIAKLQEKLADPKWGGDEYYKKDLAKYEKQLKTIDDALPLLEGTKTSPAKKVAAAKAKVAKATAPKQTKTHAVNPGGEDSFLDEDQKFDSWAARLTARSKELAPVLAQFKQEDRGGGNSVWDVPSNGSDEDIMRKWLGAWQGSSNTPAVKDLARAAKELTGKDAPTGTYASSNPDVPKAIARAIYDQTQKQLADAGVSHVRLYRGLKTQDYTHDGSGTFESWTSDRSIAENFAMGEGASGSTDHTKSGTVLTMDVPAADIFSTSKSGMGTDYEREYVVIPDKNLGPTIEAVSPKTVIPKQAEAPKIESTPEALSTTAPGYAGPSVKIPPTLKQETVDAYIALAMKQAKWEADPKSPQLSSAERMELYKLDVEIGKQSDGTIRSRVEQLGKIEASLDAWRTEHGLADVSADELKQQLADETRQAFADKKIGVRVTPQTLAVVLSDGRFKTQFETNTSAGYNNPEFRARYEAQWFGIGQGMSLTDAAKVDPEKRPLYGYVMTDDIRPTEEVGKDVLSWYGDIQVVLKDDVRKRTTAMFGDSLNDHTYGMPSPVDNPSWESFTPMPRGGNSGTHGLTLRDRDVTSEKNFKSHTYAEAQIHGGVSTGDIEEVVFAEQPDSTEITSQLDAAGIPWRVVDHNTVSIPKPADAPKIESTPAEGVKMFSIPPSVTKAAQDEYIDLIKQQDFFGNLPDDKKQQKDNLAKQITDMIDDKDEATRTIDALEQLGRVEQTYDEFRARHNITTPIEEHKAELATKVKDAFADKDIAVRVTHESLSAILGSGRFMSQFESGLATGVQDMLGKAHHEASWFGTSPHAKDDKDKRAIYGYVAMNGIVPVDSDGSAWKDGPDKLSMFGMVQVVLKKDVRSRTAAMYGDSAVNWSEGRLSPIDNPTWESFTGIGDPKNFSREKALRDLDRDPTSFKFRSTAYAEAAITGGVTTDDIAEVVFDKNPTPAIQEQLAEKGIPWRVLTMATAVKAAKPNEREPIRRMLEANVQHYEEAIKVAEAERDEHEAKGWGVKEQNTEIKKLNTQLTKAKNSLAKFVKVAA